MPAFTLGFGKHLVAKALHLTHDGLNKYVKLHFARIRSDHAQVDGFRHEPQQRNASRIAIDEACGVQKIGNSDLVRRQTIAHGIHYLLSVNPDKGPRWAVGTNGIDKDHTVRFRKQSQKGQTKRPPVFQMYVRRDPIGALHASNRSGTKSIIAKQHIAKSENEDADSFHSRLSYGILAHEMPAFRLDKNL